MLADQRASRLSPLAFELADHFLADIIKKLLGRGMLKVAHIICKDQIRLD